MCEVMGNSNHHEPTLSANHSLSPPAARGLRALWRTIERHPLLTVLFVAAFLAQAIPIWLIRILPQGDIYQHLAVAEIIHNYHTPGSIYPELFKLPDFIKPNLLYYYTVHWLALVLPTAVPLETANKIFLTLYVLLVPLSLAYLLDSFGRPRRLALFGFLFLFSGLFRTGFAGYLISVPLLFFALGLFYRFLRNGGVGRGFGVIALACLIFLAHAQMYLLYMLLAGIMGLLLWAGLRRTFRNLLVPGASLILFVPWFIRFFLLYEDHDEVHTFAPPSEGFGAAYRPPSQTLERVFTYLLDYFRDSGDEVLLLLTLLCMAVGLMARGQPEALQQTSRVAADKAHGRHWSARFLPEVLTIVVGATVFLLPVHIRNQAVISARHIPLFAIMLVTWMGWFRGRVLGVVFALALGTLIIAQGVYVGNRFLAYDRELDDYPALFDEMRPWSRLYKVSGSHLFSEVANGNVFWHLHYNFMLWHGGVTDVQFAEFVTCPVRYRPGKVPPTLPYEPGRSTRFHYYDYFLVQRSELGRVESMRPWLRQISANRGWVLFERRERPFERWWDLERLAPPERHRPGTDDSG